MQEKRKLQVKVKTVDGSVFLGEFHFRPSFHRVKDDLNAIYKTYIALTNASDQDGNDVGLTYLLNFNTIAFIAVDDANYEESHQNEEVKHVKEQVLPKRKVKAVIRLVGGSVLDCTIFVRNTLSRTADELNLKEDKFIAAVDVQEKNAPPNDRPTTYFINKKQVVSVAVADNDLLISELKLD